MEVKKATLPEVLRPEQHDAYEAIRGFFDSGLRSGYVRIPTGVGKTVLFGNILRELHENDGDHRSLVLTSRAQLVHQTVNTFQDKAGLPAEETGVISADYQGHKHRSELLAKPTVVMTYSMLQGLMKEGGIRLDSFDTFILDESHHALAPGMSDLIQKLKERSDCKVLGFTATPQYSPDKSLKVLLENEIYSMSVIEAAEKGLVSSFSVVLANTSADLRNVRVTAGGDYSEEELEKAINTAEVNTGAANLYRQAFSGQKAIAYCAGINHAESVSTLFNEQGIRAAAVSSLTPHQEKRDILARHERGEIEVLCNADLLIEGYDDPGITVCLNLRPTLSGLLAEQRGGRAIRVDQNNPDKHAYIVDFIPKEEKKKNRSVTYAQVVENGGALSGYRRNQNGNYDGEGNTRMQGREDAARVAVDGLEVITHAEEVMRQVRKRLAETYDKAGPEEYTVDAMVRRLGLNASRIRTMIEKAQMQGTEKLDARGNVRLHYSPEQYAMLLLQKASLNYPPAGWLNAGEAAAQIGVKKQGSVTAMVTDILAKYPELAGLVREDCIGPRGLPTNYYSPELIARLTARSHLAKKQPGFFSVWEICEGKAVSEWHPKRAGLKKWLETQRADHPEWFTVGLSASNQPTEYVSIDAIEAYRNSLRPDSGSRVQVNDAARQLGVSRTTVLNWLGQMGEEIEESRSPLNKQPANFISREAYVRLLQHKQSFVPQQGETSVTQIAREMGLTAGAIISRIKAMCLPEEEDIHFRMGKGDNQPTYYLSQSLADIIRTLPFRRRTK